MGLQYIVIFTHFDALHFIPAPCDVTNVLDLRHQNTITWPLEGFREFLRSFKLLIIYLNLVFNSNGLAVYSDFSPILTPLISYLHPVT